METARPCYSWAGNGSWPQSSSHWLRNALQAGPAPHLSFSHVQHGDLVGVVGRDLVQELHRSLEGLRGKREAVKGLPGWLSSPVAFGGTTASPPPSWLNTGRLLPPKNRRGHPSSSRASSPRQRWTPCPSGDSPHLPQGLPKPLPEAHSTKRERRAVRHEECWARKLVGSQGKANGKPVRSCSCNSAGPATPPGQHRSH